MSTAVHGATFPSGLSIWDVHAAIAGKMELGHGGLYQHLCGDEQSPRHLCCVG
jgi:hypothetical protein